MRTRTTLAAAALVAAGAVLGWLAASGRLPAVLAQDKKPDQPVTLLTPIAITNENLNQAERLNEVK